MKKEDIAKAIKKTKTKRVPTTLFGYQIQHSPEAHRLSIALNMAQVSCNIPTCDLILRLQKKMLEMGGKFDISTAIDIQMQVTEEYDKLEEKFKTKTKNK